MPSRAHLTELAHRLRTAAQALKHPRFDHILSFEERAALCKEVKAIAAELRRDWHLKLSRIGERVNERGLAEPSRAEVHAKLSSLRVTQQLKD